MPQRLIDVPLGLLVPETQTWDNGRPVNLVTWIHRYVGKFGHAIAYGEIFWPEFIEYDGCILLADFFSEENYQGFLRQTGGNKQAVEAVINHQHIVDIISLPTEYPPNSDLPELQAIYLGRLLKEMWQAKLDREFPDRSIVVSFEESGESMEDFVITFHQS